MDSLMQRTVKVRLNANEAQAQTLAQTVEVYTACFNQTTAYGWGHHTDQIKPLHDAMYRPLRASYPQMKSQLVISAYRKGAEALSSAFALVQKHQARQAQADAGQKVKVGRAPTCPASSWCPIRYDARSYTVNLRAGMVSLCTVEPKRMGLTFSVPEALKPYTTWQTASADLCRDKRGRWWLHVVVTAPAPPVEVTGQVLGVDLGINAPAFDSEGRRYGHDHWRIVEEGYRRVRARLQAKGTRSAKRKLKARSGRQQRFRRDCDHVLSKQLVNSVDPGAVIVMEDLTNIRFRAQASKAQRGRLHGWSFAQVQALIQYKAQGRGVTVALVDPRYTSQTCSGCGHCARANRPSQAVFCCLACGLSLHADLNASLNIRAKYLQGLPVNQPIVSNAFPYALRCKPPTSVGGC